MKPEVLIQNLYVADTVSKVNIISVDALFVNAARASAGMILTDRC